MTFREAVDVCLKQKYFFKFAGRASRSEFWWFVAFVLGLNIIVWFIVILLPISFPPMLGLSLALLVSLLLFPASLGVTVRRLHDRDLNGWWILPSFVPLFIKPLGGVILLVYTIIYCMPGTPGPNRFGPNPLLNN